jgi:hypothetical protein
LEKEEDKVAEKVQPKAFYEITSTVRFDEAMTLKELNRASKKLDKAVIKAATAFSENLRDSAFTISTGAEEVEGSDGNQA